eukprot:1805029-Heterocapsa_arctica.AAC.1
MGLAVHHRTALTALTTTSPGRRAGATETIPDRPRGADVYLQRASSQPAYRMGPPPVQPPSPRSCYRHDANTVATP